MDANDFYEEDEPIEDVRAAWKRGERGVTEGKKDLSPRAKAIVDRAVARWDSPTPDAVPQITDVSWGTSSSKPKVLDRRNDSALMSQSTGRVQQLVR